MPPATPPATSCCATSPRCCWRGSARSTWPRASAATSSPSSCSACSLPTALNVAEQIRARVDSHSLVWQGRHFRVGVSIGVVQIDDGYEDVASVIAAADDACYAAKHAGRNRVRSGGQGLRLVHDGKP